ncbi:MAG: PadR family transcriptional regulator [Anaerolineales bacterium]|jgi:DNA-binding PadR family transcriptional regulator|nr:PadR family transcriptional regulator [Anaerolineales bacterium]
MFFMETCLLLLLQRASGYGYSLMEDLREFGFQPEQMDISILYRALRDLETAGLVRSSWSDESLGPQRRMYSLTPPGETSLAEWIESLRQRRREIETLETAYERVKKSVS